MGKRRRRLLRTGILAKNVYTTKAEKEVNLVTIEK